MVQFNKIYAGYLLIPAASILLAGCAMGPDFKEPATPQVNGYTPAPPSTTSESIGVIGGESQSFVSGQDVSGEWWKLFHSKALNVLIDRSLKANPDLKAAQAALTVAHETTLSQYGTYYPGVAGNFSATRQKTSQVISPVPNSGVSYFNLFTAQVSVTYVPDVFGVNRRTIESLKAQEEQARYAMLATDIALSSNVVTAAIQEASLREQIDATHQLITLNSDMLRIIRNKLATGQASMLDVAAQESQLDQVTTTLPPLLKQLAQVRNLLAVLSGSYPDDGLSEEFKLSSLQLPQELPLSLPSQLVRQRPDIRQADENLHAASAQIGVAVANRFPSIMLTPNVGDMSLAIGQIFASGNGFWGLAGNLSQPIFDGGTLMHKERAARAAYTEAAEQYRSTVLTAFQNVADTLNALEQDADALKATVDAKNATRTTLDLTKRQWQSGSANYLAVLGAEQAYQQALIGLVQSQSNRYADTAALFQALGGGWWNQHDLVSN